MSIASKLVTLAMLCLSLCSFAQTNKSTLSGYIKDSQTGETLIGAYIYNAANKTTGNITNEYGFYSLTLPNGTYTIEVSYIGYTTKQLQLNLSQNQSLSINLDPEGILMRDVEIVAKRKDENVQSTRMGVMELPIEQVKELPALMGEVDVIRTMQLMPGVKSGGEASVGFYVRGGGPDQNLVLLDEAVVYNTGHLFGFFSVFNSDALKNTTLHKGNMPAEYGGRLASVLDVQMKEGNNQKYTAEGGIGLISSRLTLQGPIQKNKSSFLISGRRTYIDVLVKPFLKGGDFEGNGYYFYDLNTKFNYQFSEKDRLFVSGYFGRDVFDFKSPDGFSFNMPWGNATATMRWNHVFNNKLFMNTTAIYNSYNFAANSKFQGFESKFYSGVKDWNAKIDLDYFPSPKHTIKGGVNYTYHTFTPYSFNATVGDVEFSNEDLNQQYAHELAAYIQDDFSIGENWKFNVGLRASGYQQVGPYKTTEFSPQGIPTDTIEYKAGEGIATYGGLEPRVNFRYSVSAISSIKGGVAVTNQYIHLVSNSGSTLPTDLWVPSTQKTKPQKGIQYSLGYFQNFFEDKLEGSVEVYYKDLKNQIEFSEEYVPELGKNIEDSYVFGKGRAYGVELFLNKKYGKFTGWIGYTYSVSERKFDNLNNQQWFPTKYDRTHDASVVATYKLSKRWTTSAVWVYGTGNALTLPNSFYLIGGSLYTEYDMPRNSYRLKPYHRLDLSATCKLNKKETARVKSELAISIYNVYSRANPFFVYPNIDYASTQTNGNINVQLKQVSLFPIIPSVTYNFKF